MKSHEKQELVNQIVGEKLRLDSNVHEDLGKKIATKADELEFAIGQLPTRFDAGESAFLTRQLIYFQAREVTQQFVDVKILSLVPVDTSIPSGAEQFQTPIWTQVGSAKIVSNYGTDFPASDAYQAENLQPIRSFGTSFQYSIQDLRRSAMAGGMPLDQRKATTARMVNDQLVENIGTLGDTASGLGGFTQNSLVTVLTAGAAVTGAWASASGATITDDLGKMAAKVFTQSKGKYKADTILLAGSPFQYASTVRANAFSQEDCLSAFIRTNQWGIRNIDYWPYLDTAGASSATRAVVYSRNSNLLDMKIPQPFEMLAPQQKMAAFIVPCHSRFGGVVVYYPLSMVYVDGL